MVINRGHGQDQSALLFYSNSFCFLSGQLWSDGNTTPRREFNIPDGVSSRTSRQFSSTGKLTSKTGVDMISVLQGYLENIKIRAKSQFWQKD